MRDILQHNDSVQQQQHERYIATQWFCIQQQHERYIATQLILYNNKMKNILQHNDSVQVTTTTKTMFKDESLHIFDNNSVLANRLSKLCA